ncbi:MAG: hypothetical protein WC955_03920 [Elusimicrobiota bacterium]
MKIIAVLTTLIVLLSAQSGYCIVLDVILDAVSWAAKQVNEVNEELFRKTMIAQTIESAATLKRNYDDSVKFYDEMRSFNENPYGYFNQWSTEFANTLTDPVAKYNKDIDSRVFSGNSWYANQTDGWKAYRDKTLSFSQNVSSAVAAQMNSTELSKKIKSASTKLEAYANYNLWDQKNREEKIEANETYKSATSAGIANNYREIESIGTKLKSGKKEDVEVAKVQMELMNAKLLQNLNYTLLKLFEGQIDQDKRDLSYKQFLYQQQQQVYSTAQTLINTRKQLYSNTSRENQAQNMLGETPRIEHPSNIKIGGGR